MALKFGGMVLGRASITAGYFKKGALSSICHWPTCVEHERTFRGPHEMYQKHFKQRLPHQNEMRRSVKKVHWSLFTLTFCAAVIFSAKIFTTSSSTLIVQKHCSPRRTSSSNENRSCENCFSTPCSCFRNWRRFWRLSSLFGSLCSFSVSTNQNWLDNFFLEIKRNVVLPWNLVHFHFQYPTSDKNGKSPIFTLKRHTEQVRALRSQENKNKKTNLKRTRTEKMWPFAQTLNKTAARAVSILSWKKFDLQKFQSQYRGWKSEHMMKTILHSMCWEPAWNAWLRVASCWTRHLSSHLFLLAQLKSHWFIYLVQRPPVQCSFLVFWTDFVWLQEQLTK